MLHMALDQYIFIGILYINLLTFIMFGIDKKRAVRDAWRIRESTLLILSLIGGSVGALVGMTVFRHKIRKMKFVMLVPVFFAMHLVLLLLFLRR